MTVEEFLAAHTEALWEAGITTARLDVLVLLEDLLGIDRSRILARPGTILSDDQTHILDEQIKRRARHVPLAYLRGKTEFYGRDFIVSEYVLEPRPESETMIDMLKDLPANNNMTVIDVGTGSGALAVTAKLELPETTVLAIDIDPRCLGVTRQNAKKHRASITVLEGDLLQPIAGEQPESYTLLCNLPYVPDSFQINTAASHEPRIAIFGGEDGLDLYRKLFTQLRTYPRQPHYVLTESLPPQHEHLSEIAKKYGYQVKRSQDFIQLFVPTPSIEK